MATHQPSTTGPPDSPAEPYTRNRSHTEAVPTVPAEELLELLGDEYTRSVLQAITDQPRTGREIIDATDASKPTVYRRLDRLEDAGLVETTQRLDPDGHHCKQFHVVIDGLDFEFGQDGVCVSVQTDAQSESHTARGFVADD